jgi:hypothetical protein
VVEAAAEPVVSLMDIQDQAIQVMVDLVLLYLNIQIFLLFLIQEVV